MSKIYPYDAWVLMPSFKPAKITIVKSYGSTVFHGDIAESGKYYVPDELYKSRAEAIAAGHAILDKKHASINKQLSAMTKKRDALIKAEGDES